MSPDDEDKAQAARVSRLCGFLKGNFFFAEVLTIDARFNIIYPLHVKCSTFSLAVVLELADRHV